MTGFTDRHFFLLAVVLYGVSTVYSVFLWRKGFRQRGWVPHHRHGQAGFFAFPVPGEQFV
jgi:hypothetical protein